MNGHKIAVDYSTECYYNFEGFINVKSQDTKFSNAINAKICEYFRIFKHILYLHIGYFISGFQVREAAGGS